MFRRVRGSRSGKKLEARGLGVKGILCVVESPPRDRATAWAGESSPLTEEKNRCSRRSLTMKNMSSSRWCLPVNLLAPRINM
ncbi:uncharacterized protein LOC100278229 [Zea mays]|uniref:Uncharacterized protein n=1 Tax=Zea mays TaxID=4577 RepID=B6U5H2_MAIZE|nr:uncharacterized protein LOC100278229 [Zea mays]ACG44605.1 hypothetical protein [Zea mays]